MFADDYFAATHVKYARSSGAAALAADVDAASQVNVSIKLCMCVSFNMCMCVSINMCMCVK
jgi:hypothetical protein